MRKIYSFFTDGFVFMRVYVKKLTMSGESEQQVNQLAHGTWDKTSYKFGPNW